MGGLPDSFLSKVAAKRVMIELYCNEWKRLSKF